MKEVLELFKNRKAELIGKYKRNSVVILITYIKGEAHVVFEKRALTMRTQPGDVSLPGGGIEEKESPQEAAIREAVEELGISKDSIKNIGEMDYFISPYNSIIYTFVAELTEKIDKPNKDEVDEVFYVPLKFLLENSPEEYEMELIPKFEEEFPFELINGGRKYKFRKRVQNQYFYKYKGYVIWGFTALIIKRFVDLINENK
ncbi:NUDIX hydrolase [Clostridium grantii]|uniref:ADP-ribose pyrophosphatase YjhB, NUDIX family n=1 Tax=Clostridium grantii DSM 8605 TaxID=1121316 RepID=A0A1M5RHX2_9CLOT|nr:CoA pyrophosphatase [Clostridium grantii]SHH25609.1 ADP-ribose pyrophosphatase YjhB, NUDIX family [Clostridium grantii DSM 8605]